MHNQSSILHFIVNNRKQPLVMILLLIVFGIILLFIQPKLFIESWGNWLECYLAFAILVFGTLIWWGELKQDYRAQLPKKLNIQYRFEEQCWEIKNAPLAAEGDIRAWGQSIGNATFNKTKFFKIKSFQTCKPRYLPDKTVFELIIYMDEPLENNKLRTVSYHDNGILDEKVILN